ncbi:MAG TPA: GAF and ANTAR domain-containing protein [Pseudonocardia sp.]|nr:GAF and ANTAR domain-containing protein [Pseudonocardia sp.]
MRSDEVAGALVEFADTLVAEFDIVEFLQRLTDRCVELLPVDAAGLVLADTAGRSQVLAATSDDARLVELIQLHLEEGPCVECLRDGQPVDVGDVAHAGQRWPRFSPALLRLGFHAVQALPLRRRSDVIGAMNLFRTTPGELDAPTVRIARAFTDVATIGLLQQRARREQELLVEQLQTALASRVLIEQAKGVLAERLKLGTEQAFTLLRQHARSRNHRLTDLARAVIEGHADLSRPGSA